MLVVHRPPVRAYRITVTTSFNELQLAVMARLAYGLQIIGVDEQMPDPPVWCHVMHDLSRTGGTFLEAHGTQWVTIDM